MSTHSIQFHDVCKMRKQVSQYLFSCAVERFSYGLKNEFESSMVNEPSGFESSRFYCNLRYLSAEYSMQRHMYTGHIYMVSLVYVFSCVRLTGTSEPRQNHTCSTCVS